MPAPATRTALLAALLLAGAATAAPDGTPAAAPQTDQEPAPRLTQAQQLVFANDLMQKVPAGSVLEYRFTRHGKDLPDYQDRITVTVTCVADDGKRDLQFDFLSGGHHLDFQPATAYRGNPVPIQFLERDIKELAAATEGASGYFRNRLRAAFAQAQSEPVTIPVDGQEVPGVRITLKPFAGDPNSARFKDYADKGYEFLFSEQVPGGLYQISTRVPSAGSDAPLIEEQLTFDHRNPDTPTAH